MRRVGIGALGAVGGLLLALVLQDLLAVAALRHGGLLAALGLPGALLLPGLTALGAVVAVVLDRRVSARGSTDRDEG